MQALLNTFEKYISDAEIKFAAETCQRVLSNYTISDDKSKQDKIRAVVVRLNMIVHDVVGDLY